MFKESYNTDAGSIAVANPTLHPQMIAALQSARAYAVNSRDGLDLHLSPELSTTLKQKWPSSSDVAK